MIWKQKIITNRLTRYVKRGGNVPGSKKENTEMEVENRVTYAENCIRLEGKYPVGTILVMEGHTPQNPKLARSMGAPAREGTAIVAERLLPMGRKAIFLEEERIVGIAKPKSREDLEKLKKDWMSDQSWDIWATEGFEHHYEELKELQRHVEKSQRQVSQERRDAEARSWGVSHNEALFKKISSMNETIIRMQLVIDRLEERVEELELCE